MYSDDTFKYIRPHLGHTEITVSYSDNIFGYIHIEITVSYSDSTFGYIQLFPVSASKVFAGMNIKENEKYTQRKCINYMRSIALLCDDSIQLQEQEIQYRGHESI